MNKTSPNAVEWFEIPTADLGKSIPFYNQVLGLRLEANDFGPNRIAIFPHENPGPGGCLMQGPDMVPSGGGSVVYLSTPNIDTAIAQVEASGGKITVPKTRSAQTGGSSRDSWIWKATSLGSAVQGDGTRRFEQGISNGYRSFTVAARWNRRIMLDSTMIQRRRPKAYFT